ncbi:hypothetical protein HAX54_005786 [Datura stramonium]|uniref:Uncharacterized protein n=1 Tax=Datura stramonium TaxID=4076 RepID=A0ABS8WVQ6_DATST|nr:hypothetical protein [Datura stramonium]
MAYLYPLIMIIPSIRYQGIGMPVNHFYMRDGGQLGLELFPLGLLSPRLVDIAHLYRAPSPKEISGENFNLEAWELLKMCMNNCGKNDLSSRLLPQIKGFDDLQLKLTMWIRTTASPYCRERVCRPPHYSPPRIQSIRRKYILSFHLSSPMHSQYYSPNHGY